MVKINDMDKKQVNSFVVLYKQRVNDYLNGHYFMEYDNFDPSAFLGKIRMLNNEIGNRKLALERITIPKKLFIEIKEMYCYE